MGCVGADQQQVAVEFMADGDTGLVVLVGIVIGHPHFVLMPGLGVVDGGLGFGLTGASLHVNDLYLILHR